MNTPNKWLQIHIGLESDNSETISEFLTDELGALAITLIDAEDHALFQLEPGDMPLWDKVIMTVLFPAGHDPDHIMQELLSKQLVNEPIKWRSEILEEKDWVHDTQKSFPAKRFADSLWVIPRWDDKDYPNPKIYIDPGLAFGTGTHPTTSLCLEWLAQNPPTKKTVIDFGCGSGILSLAACALGATAVYAIDHDEQAILATKQNSELNKTTTQHLITGKDTILPKEFKAELVIANILAKPLLTLHPILLQHTAANGTLILSGLLEKDFEEILACYTVGYTLLDKKLDGEWLRLIFTKI